MIRALVLTLTLASSATADTHPYQSALDACLSHRQDPQAIDAALRASGWTEIAQDQRDAAANTIGDGLIFAGKVPTDTAAIRQERAQQRASIGARIKRKPSAYFASATYSHGADQRTYLNVFWQKQGGKLTCAAGSSDIEDLQAVTDRVLAYGDTSDADDIGPAILVHASSEKPDTQLTLMGLKTPLINSRLATPLRAGSSLHVSTRGRN